MSGYQLLPRVDRLGRPQADLHRLGDGPTLTTLCAQAGVPIKRVPPEFWSLDATDAGVPLAVVSCPCGDEHTLPLLEGPHGEAECRRGYWFDGVGVWVLNSPTQVSSAPTSEP